MVTNVTPITLDTGTAIVNAQGVYEYTHPDLAKIFDILLDPIATVFGSDSGAPFTNAQLADFEHALDRMNFFAQEGVMIDGSTVQIFTTQPNANLPQNLVTQPYLHRDGSSIGNIRFYFTVNMIHAINEINRTLKATGFFAAQTPAAKEEALQVWVDQKTAGLSDILLRAAMAVDNRTLQGQVMLEYVKEGNELLEKALTSVKQVLEINKAALDTLERFQDLMNRLEPEVRTLGIDDIKSAFITVGRNTRNQTLKKPLIGASRLFPTGPQRVTAAPRPETRYQGVSQAVSDFRVAYSAAFSLPLTPTTPGLAQAQGDWMRLRGALDNHIAGLAAVEGQNQPGTLYTRLIELRDNINAAQGANLTEQLTNWVKDKRGSTTATDAGGNQRTLTEAITAAENLNDQQKTELRRFLFVFEEFYKSSSALLSAINKLIQRIAQAAAR